MVNLAIAQEQEQSGKGQPILEQVRELYKLIPEYLDFFNDERHPSLEDLLILLRRAGLEAEAVQLEHRVKLWTK
jgi:hypothetical protein